MGRGDIGRPTWQVCRGYGIPMGMGIGYGDRNSVPRQPCGYLGMFAVSAIEILNVICKWIIARARLGLPSVGFRS